MAVVRRTRLVELVWRLHRRAFEATGGRVGTKAMGMPVLLLTTRGRRSGEPRKVTLMYMDDDGTPVVVASNAGEPKHPAWWANQKADPKATVMTRGKTRAVRAREAQGAERERLWSRIVEVNDDYAEYQRRAGDREVPVVVLESTERAS